MSSKVTLVLTEIEARAVVEALEFVSADADSVYDGHYPITRRSLSAAARARNKIRLAISNCQD